jgi:nicotinamidase-related amidase
MPVFIDPSRTALLVMDFQNGIVDGLPGSAALVTRVASTVAAARAAGVRIGHVRVALDDQDYAAVPVENKAFSGIAAAGALREGSEAAEIVAALTPQPGDVVVRKTRFGGFSTTNLARLLSQREVDTLILAGISTAGVVLSTVRDAADRDYRIVVLEDGSADRNPRLHQMLMRHVFPVQAEVVSCADFIRRLASLEPEPAIGGARPAL